MQWAKSRPYVTRVTEQSAFSNQNEDGLNEDDHRYLRKGKVALAVGTPIPGPSSPGDKPPASLSNTWISLKHPEFPAYSAAGTYTLSAVFNSAFGTSVSSRTC